MFTGIIEVLGQVNKIHLDCNQHKLDIYIDSLKINKKIFLGDSIAINGVCLTVESFKNNIYSFNLSNETVKLSNLSNLKEKLWVNIETSLTLQKGINGHLVTGHIDNTGNIISIEKNGKNTLLEINIPKNLLKFTPNKGAITINGVSLTINEVTKNSIILNLIPFTLKNTIFQYSSINDKVNLEIDMIARYVENFLSYK